MSPSLKIGVIQATFHESVSVSVSVDCQSILHTVLDVYNAINYKYNTKINYIKGLQNKMN